MNGDDRTGVGFYGKVPARGDFISRRLPRNFVDRWDEWLQQSLAATMEQLGDGWLDSYLEAPLWRFLLGPGVCGDAVVAGVIMPSVDRVGRYFPLTLAATLNGCAAPTRTAISEAEWFERLETLALSTLADDADFDAFDRESEALASLSAAVSRASSSDTGIVVALNPEESLAAAAVDLNDMVMVSAWPHWALWWTTGSERLRPCAVTTRALPGASKFAAFLDGQWERWGWMTP